ncbi:CU044_5270 family protein [Spirillospora sp. CA-253888]
MSLDPRSGAEPDERAELARLLPEPGASGLSADRHRLLKEDLMTRIQRPVPAAGVRRFGTQRRRWVLSLTAVPLTAAAVAAAAFVGLDVLTDGSSARAVPAAVPAPIVAVTVADTRGGAALLNRISLAAAHKSERPVRADQYVYVKSKVAWTRQVAEKALGGPVMLDPLHEREVWLAQDPGKRRGLIREWGQDNPLHGTTDDLTYEKLAALPTDPAALLRLLRAQALPLAGEDGRSLDAVVFDRIGELLRESVLPPKVSAALYRAAAGIPGVAMVRDVQDAAGRRGLAVARVEDGERTEWIFDAVTLDYLGERSYLVRDTVAGKKGMLTATTAVLGRGVVDRTGQRP